MNTSVPIYSVADNIISPLGFDSEDVFESIRKGHSGVRQNLNYPEAPLSYIDRAESAKYFEKLSTSLPLTFFEQLIIASIQQSLSKCTVNPASDDTLIILSTTKGNVDLLSGPQTETSERVMLWSSAQMVQKYFKASQTPVIISNACISGVLAINYAVRLLQAGKYKHIVVAGADVKSDFIVSGFLSFKSLSPSICKPFDRHRDGLNLGEGAGTIILSVERPATDKTIQVHGGASANDANHISGPSRTGEGLYLSIQNTIQKQPKVDYISAHGTATPYNDDMESKAIARSGLSNVPVNSFKAYIGHTLGAAGLIESILGIHSMKNQVLVGTLGYQNFGVAEDIQVIDKTIQQPIQNFLKLASGFGGCNAACFFEYAH